MKRFVSILLVITVLLALGVPAFADIPSPTGSGKRDGGAAGSGLQIFNSDDKLIAVVPSKEVIRYNIRQADKLDAADKEAFLAAYEAAKNSEDKVVLQVYWLDIPDEYKNLDDFSYAKYYFRCGGRNIELSVNGKDMEIGRLGNCNYYAKLTEFGTVVITRN